MSQPIQDVQNIVPMSEPQPRVSGLRPGLLRSLKAPLRMLAGLFFVPVLLVAALLSFFVVLTDFAFFRLRDLRAGHPQQKGLWEF